MSTLSTMTIHEVAPLIESRQVSPVEVTHEALDRIEALEPRLHAFISIYPEQALADAKVAEQEITSGNYRGPLHGLPIGIKDNFAVAGWPATNGSSLMKDYIPDYDASVVQRLRAAGSIIVGKNNLHEWHAGGTSAGGPFGSVHNPWNETMIPGGSSGGSAAAVSASMIFASVGSDGMGSVRIPAAYCGIVGLKPTYGRVSRFGELEPSSSSTDQPGPLTKDVRDAAILLSALAGHDPQDPVSVARATEDYVTGLDRGINGLTIGLPLRYFFDQATPEVRDLVRQAVGVLESLGVEAQEVDMPSLRYMPLVGAATVNEGRAFLHRFVLQGPQGFAHRSIWERAISDEFVRGSDVLKAMRLRNLMRQEFLEVMEHVDLLAMPTTVSPAFPIDMEEGFPGGFADAGGATTTLTIPFNIVGMPAITVPCGFSHDGLPIGLMLAARHWEDAGMLRAAYAYEQATTHGYQPPPMATAAGG